MYHQKSDYYPVSRDNKRYIINDGDIVFINRNTQGVGGIDSTIYSVDVIGNIWKRIF